MYAEGFASKLKKARENIGFTQIEVSRETKINRNTLAGYEVGKSQPDLETLGILADFYAVSVDWLLGTSGGKAANDNYHVVREKNPTDTKRAI